MQPIRPHAHLPPRCMQIGDVIQNSLISKFQNVLSHKLCTQLIFHFHHWLNYDEIFETKSHVGMFWPLFSNHQLPDYYRILAKLSLLSSLF
jgi:hypothetical protein